MISNLTIRPAREDDYEVLMDLYGDFVADDIRFQDRESNSFQKVLADDNAFLDVTVDSDRIIGFVAYYIRSVVRFPTPILEIEELYVVPEYRHGGIARKLIDHVFTFAKDKECHFVFVSSAKDRTIAHKFYRSLGFEEYGLHYRRKP